MALDATGFSRRPASRYYVTRLSRGHGAHRFSLASTVIWATPQVIWAQEARLGPGSQSRLLPPLIQQTQAILPIDRVLADADYDSEATHRWLREARGIESIILATGCHPGRAKTPYRRRMQRYFPRRQYGQRWMAETVYSVIKRKFGEALTARRPWQQVKQGLLRGLTYNLYCAVRLGLVLLRRLLHRLITGSITVSVGLTT